MKQRIVRIVLDTNIWLDWLVFDDTGIHRIRQLQEAGHVEILIDAPCEAEFAEVITRKFQKKTLDAQARAAALAHIRRLTTRIDAQLPPPERARLPRCKDPDDQKFLELAFAGAADVLITKDRALLDIFRRRKKQVGRTVSFKILTPEEFEEL